MINLNYFKITYFLLFSFCLNAQIYEGISTEMLDYYGSEHYAKFGIPVELNDAIFFIDSIHYKTKTYQNDSLKINRKYFSLIKSPNFYTWKAELHDNYDQYQFPKYIFEEYNNSGELKKYLLKRNDTENQNDTLFYYQINDFGKLDILQYSYFPWCGNDFTPNYHKYINEFDQNGNLINSRYEVILKKVCNQNLPTGWVKYFNYSFSYDEQGRDTLQIISKADSSYNYFMNYQKINNYYQGDKLEQTINYNWEEENHEWLKNGKIVLFEKNDTSYKEYYLWNVEEKKWKPSGRSLNFFIDEKNTIQYEKWNIDKWDFSYRYVYYSSGIRNFENHYYEKWNNEVKEWEKYSWMNYYLEGDTIVENYGYPTYKSITKYLFNENDQIVSKISYKFKDNIAKIDSRYDWAYSSNGLLLSKSLTDFSDIYTDPYIEKEEYFWGKALKNNANKREHFDMFPNPSSGLSKIVMNFVKSINNKVSVYDNQGKLIFKDSFEGFEYDIDLQNSPRGIYFINLNGEMTSKLIKY